LPPKLFAGLLSSATTFPFPAFSSTRCSPPALSALRRNNQNSFGFGLKAKIKVVGNYRPAVQAFTTPSGGVTTTATPARLGSPTEQKEQNRSPTRSGRQLDHLRRQRRICGFFSPVTAPHQCGQPAVSPLLLSADVAGVAVWNACRSVVASLHQKGVVGENIKMGREQWVE
jgi:hypothetical protein